MTAKLGPARARVTGLFSFLQGAGQMIAGMVELPNLTNLTLLPNPTVAMVFDCGKTFSADNSGMVALMDQTAESLSVGDVAWVLEQSEQTVRRLFDEGALKGPPRRAHRRIHVESLREMIEGDPVQTRRLGRVLSRLAR